MKYTILAVVAVLILPLTALSDPVEPPVEPGQWTPKAKLLTAQSCVGEAGFRALDECMAIAWVYATRAREMDRGYAWTVKQYSSPLKKHLGQLRPWIHGLNLEGKRPKLWPKSLRWKAHRKYWFRLLVSLDEWSVGMVPNPVHGANHFGSRDDLRNMQDRRSWQRIKAPRHFQNLFFSFYGSISGRF